MTGKRSSIAMITSIIFKYGKDFIVRAHRKKTNIALVNAGQVKRLVNSSKNFFLLMIKPKFEINHEYFEGCDPKLNQNYMMWLMGIMRCFRSQQNCLQKGKFNMRFSCSRIVLFQTSVCIACR